MWFCPTPDNRPVRAAQRQRKVNRRRPKKNPRELPSGNENGRLRGCHPLAYLQRDELLTPNRQRTRFYIRPPDDFLHQATQWSVISIVIALHMKRSTDRNRSFTSPDGKTERVVD